MLCGDSAWIGAGIVEKQARKPGLIALKMATGTNCSCCLPGGGDIERATLEEPLEAKTAP